MVGAHWKEDGRATPLRGVVPRSHPGGRSNREGLGTVDIYLTRKRCAGQCVLRDHAGMSPGLYFKSAEGKLTELEPRVLGETADLQPLLAREPRLLAGDRDGSAGRYVLVKRELGIVHGEDAGARWSVDHLFLDDEGVPTLVEVKQSANTQIRREVVGQLLEYAANFADYWSAEIIRDSFETAWRDRGREPEEVLQEAVPPWPRSPTS